MGKYIKRCPQCGITFWMIPERDMVTSLIPKRNEFLVFKHVHETGHYPEIIFKD